MHPILPSTSAFLWPVIRRALPLAVVASLALFATPATAPVVVEVTLYDGTSMGGYPPLVTPPSVEEDELSSISCDSEAESGTRRVP